MGVYVGVGMIVVSSKTCNITHTCTDGQAKVSLSHSSSMLTWNVYSRKKQMFTVNIIL